MLIFYWLPFQFDPITQIAVDALVLAILSAPIIYFFSILPYVNQKSRATASEMRALNRLAENNMELKYQKHTLDEHAVVSISDAKGKITYVNEKFCKISGYRADELIGQNHRIMKSDEHPAEFYSDLWNTITRGKDWHGEIKNRHKNGRPIWFRGTIVPFLNEHGVPFQYVAIRTDITENKDLERALLESKKELENTVNELNMTKDGLEKQAIQLRDLGQKLKYQIDVKDRFFSIISHDLVSPFTSLLGMSQLMSLRAYNLSKEDLIQSAKDINTSGEQVYELLQNLLEWSRLQMEGAKINPEQIQLVELTRECIDVLMPTAQEKNITLKDSIKNASAFADRDMVMTVIRNLLANAIKFTPQGGLIEILSKRDGDNVQITVSDTGVGIPLDKIDLIFALDQKSSTRGTEGEMGTGLGLPLCKEMIEIIGGRIWCESKKNQGSKFHFTLPSDIEPVSDMARSGIKN